MLKTMATVNNVRINIRVDGECLLLKELKAVFICRRFLANQTGFPLQIRSLPMTKVDTSVVDR